MLFRSETNHVWFYGDPGCGKSLFVATFMPGAYAKDPISKFWQGYNNLEHDFILMSDLDAEIVNNGSLNWNFLKAVVDPGGFNADVKYSGGMRVQGVVVITSNYSIGNLMTITNPAEHFQLERAIRRRYIEFKFEELLPKLELELKPKAVLDELKTERNNYIDEVGRHLTEEERREFDRRLWTIKSQYKIDHFIRFLQGKELNPFLS